MFNRKANTVRLNRASDFALRILILLSKSDEPLSVESIAEELDLPKSHVMKIVARLASAGIIVTQRGRSGGVKLDPSARDVPIGAVVREIENNFAVVDCFAEGNAVCVFEPRCALKPAMREATEAFLQVLDRYLLSDIVKSTQRPKSVVAGARKPAAS